MKKKLFNKEWISHILGFNMRTKDIILIQLDNEAKEVQDKVKSAIETMTGLTVSEVNIRIAGIQMDYE